MKKIIIFFMAIIMYANVCQNRVFTLSTQGNNDISLQTLISNVSDTCNLNVVVSDDITQQKLQKKLKYLKLNNVTLNQFLDFILAKQGFFYTLKDNLLQISYIKTKTFKIDYVNVTVTGKSEIETGVQDNATNNSVTTEVNVDFWTDFKDNIKNIIKANKDPLYKNPDASIDKITGLVTITGTKAQLDNIQKYIDELNNKLHKEVLIDVKIYSVKLSQSHQTGINWKNFNLTFNKSAPATSANLLGSSSIFKSGTFNIYGFLNFLASYGQVNSISNPKIITLNNQKAIITVGKNINYSYNVITTDANGNAIQTTQIGTKFVGMLLDITPEISDNGVIIMNINPSISSIDPTNINPDLPPNTFEKKLNTIVRVKDGDTIVLGGLITDETSFSRNGIPLLKEIPVVKYLFSSKEKISTREELIFIMTPHIINLNKKVKIKKVFKLPNLGEF